MQANMETVQELTEQIRRLTVETANLTICLQRIQSDRIWNGRSTIHQEQELLRRIHQTGREVHSLKTKRGMLYKAMRDNQLSIIGE